MSRMSATPASRPRVLSGIQPTSDSMHLGNYLGEFLGELAIGLAYAWKKGALEWE